jgi:hypothetical protein
VGKIRESGARTYFCAKGVTGAGCNKTTSVAERLEILVADAVLVRLDTPELQKKLIGAASQDDEADALQIELDQSQEKLDELAEAYGAQRIPMREWLLARSPIDERRNQALRRMGQLVGSSALEAYVGNSEHLRAQWSSLAPDRQWAIIGALVERVTVNPGIRGSTKFNPSRYEVSWRI